MNKPEWSEASDDLEFLAMDAGGEWWFHAKRPGWNGKLWVSGGRIWRPDIPPLPNPEDTLESRP